MGYGKLQRLLRTVVLGAICSGGISTAMADTRGLVTPEVSRDGSATIFWGGTCAPSSSSSTSLKITKKAGSQTISVGTLTNSNLEIPVSGLAAGEHTYYAAVCWSAPGSRNSPGSQGCHDPYPFTLTVDPTAPVPGNADVYAVPTANVGTYDIHWQRHLYSSFLGDKTTRASFTRNGDSTRHVFHESGFNHNSCNEGLKATLPNLIPGDYQVKLEICGETTVSTTTKTCLPAKTINIHMDGEPAELDFEPIAVPSHQNNISLPHSNSDSYQALTAKTPGALSVGTGTASYIVPVKLPPAAAMIMPGLKLNYRNFRQTRDKPLVNAGHDWIVTGFSTVPDCETGTFEDCTRNREDREIFVKFKRLYNQWFQPHDINKAIAPDGTQYWYGDNARGQGGTGTQLTRVVDVYGNWVTLNYRPDNQLGFIYFSTNEAVIFNYSDEILKSVTTVIDATQEDPDQGQWVSRYELTHKQSQTSDLQLLAEVRECGFDVSQQKSCAKPIVFEYSEGQLGYEPVSWDAKDPSATIVGGPVDYNKDGHTDRTYIENGEFLVDFKVKQGEKYVPANNPMRAFSGDLGDVLAAYITANPSTTVGLHPYNMFIDDVTADGVPDVLLAHPLPGFLLAGLRGPVTFKRVVASIDFYAALFSSFFIFSLPGFR